MKENDLQKQLKKLYPSKGVYADNTRHPATAREILEVIEGGFETQLNNNLPKEEDILQKDDDGKNN